MAKKKGLTADRLIWMYTQMVRIREFESRVKRTFVEHPGVIRGHTHLGDGAEATIVGALATRQDDDLAMPSYRCHGYPLVLGTPPRKMIAGHRQIVVLSSGQCADNRGLRAIAKMRVTADHAGMLDERSLDAALELSNPHHLCVHPDQAVRRQPLFLCHRELPLPQSSDNVSPRSPMQASGSPTGTSASARAIIFKITPATGEFSS